MLFEGLGISSKTLRNPLVTEWSVPTSARLAKNKIDCRSLNSNPRVFRQLAYTKHRRYEDLNTEVTLVPSIGPRETLL